jgi:putative transposase
MPWSLKRFQEARCLHFITFSCQHRDPLLGTPESRDTFLEIRERDRNWYNFFITGYIVMPEHVHLLISEPVRTKLSTAIQMLKQNTAQKLRPVEGVPFWESRYYDFNVWSEAKRIEKLRYIHRNPVHRGSSNAPRIGSGAASIITQRGLRVPSKSSLSGLRESESARESCRRSEAKVENPTLSHKPRQGWGTLSAEKPTRVFLQLPHFGYCYRLNESCGGLKRETRVMSVVVSRVGLWLGAVGAGEDHH